MTAHTKGPWHWEADPVKGDPYGRVRFRVTALGKTITQVYYSSYEGGPTNAEHDARLIAAAPQLLEALEEIADMGAFSPDGAQEALAECRSIARAAIKAAKGEA